MAESQELRLTSIHVSDDQLNFLRVISESLYVDGRSGHSVSAMIRRAIDEFIARETARPDFQEKARQASANREALIEQLLRNAIPPTL